MKKFPYLILFLTFSLLPLAKLSAQQLLLSKSGVTVSMSSKGYYEDGDVVLVSYYIKNIDTGKPAYSKNIRTNFQVQGFKQISYSSNHLHDTIYPKDSTLIQDSITLRLDSVTTPSSNIIIIWPTGAGFKLAGPPFTLLTTKPALFKAPNPKLMMDSLKVRERSYHPGDTLHFSYYLFNNDSFKGFSDTIKSNLQIQGDTYIHKGAFNKLVTVPARKNIKIIDSVVIITPYKGSSNIIIIWPTGAGATMNSLNKLQDTAVVFTEIQDISTTLQLVVFYPNPSEGRMQLMLTDKAIQIRKASLRNIQGRILPGGYFKDNMLDLSSMAPGIYFMELQFSDGSRGEYKVVRR